MAARAAALEEELEEAMGQIEGLEREADELKAMIHQGAPRRYGGGGEEEEEEEEADDEKPRVAAPGGEEEEEDAEGSKLRDVEALQTALENAFLQNSELEATVAELEGRIALEVGRGLGLIEALIGAGRCPERSQGIRGSKP